MPSLIRLSVPCALASEFDATAWAGSNVFSRGSAVAVGSSAAVYDDALAFLHGMGSQAGRDLAADIDAAWTGAGTITMGIDSSDRVYIESSAEDFTIAAGAANAKLGFSAAGHGLVGGVAPFRRTATAEWVRGPVTWGSSARLTIDPAGAPAAFACPTGLGTVQSVVTHLRPAATADADGTGSTSYSFGTLEAWDNTANDNASRRIRWGVNADGKVYTTRPSGISSALTWTSTTFRDRLGFSGSEAEVLSDGVYTLTAAYELPGFVRPTGLSRCLSWREEVTATVGLSNGDIAANPISSASGWDVVVYVAGDALGESSLTEHMMRRLWPYCPIGYGLNIYREWGDPRRSLRRREVTSSIPAYSLLYTSEADGGRGRERCLRDISDETRRVTSQDSDVMVRQTVRVVLRNRVD